MTSITPRVFDITELASLICRFARPSARTRMCRVSRAMFRVASPIVWEHVEGVLNLLKLFPTSLISEFERFKFDIRILGPAVHAERFNLYAPFVKTLEIYGKAATHYEISGWSNLVMLSRQQTLLPNLASLTMGTNCEDCFWDVVLWTRLFASESLVTLRSIPTNRDNIPEISYLATSVFLRWAVEHCSRLKSLSLFPSKDLDHIDPEDGENKLLTLLYEEPFHHYLLPTLGIRSLACSLPVLANESLKALSELPQLQVLTIHNSSDDPPSQQVQLPENAFPSLAALSLYLPDPMDVDRVLAIHPLLTTLKVVKICLDAHSRGPDINWINNALFPILAHATRLANLHVDFDPEVRHQPLELGDISVLNPFRRLPLQVINLFSVNFQFGGTSTSLKDILPHVSILHLTRCYGRLRDLHLFAQLPDLEHLVLKLNIAMDFDDKNAPNPPLGSCFDTLEGSPGSIIDGNVDINKIARYLVSLWPNLRQVNWFGSRGADVVKALNRELQTLRNQSSGH